MLLLTGCDGSSSSGVPNQAPNATFTAGSAEQNALEYTFDASGSIDTNTEGKIDSYEWDFGDGESGSGRTVTHTYSEVGIYEVALTVVDDAGAENTYVQTVAASEPPSASFTATPDEADPTTITFDASGSTDSDGEIDSYSWNFGDGETGSGEVVTHNYDVDEDQEVGVSLTVTDGIGTAGSTTKPILIDVPVFVPIPKSSWEIVDFDSEQPGRSDLAVENVIDGDESTIWHTPYSDPRPPTPHYVSVDMGEEQYVYRFQIDGRSDDWYIQNPKVVTIEFSDDGENWRDGETFTLPFDSNGDVISAEVALTNPTRARYFKLTINQNVEKGRNPSNTAEITALTTQEAASEN
jgi:PKD repeat protein